MACALHRPPNPALQLSGAKSIAVERLDSILKGTLLSAWWADRPQLSSALDDSRTPDRASPVSVRSVLLWIGANMALAIVLSVCGAIWLTVRGQSQDFAGPTGAGRGGLLPLGTLLFFVAAVLLVANLVWAIVLAARRR